MNPFKTIFLMLAVIFSFTTCMKNPTEGFKVEGSIANFQDCSHIDKVMAFAVGDNYDFKAKISESKFENNYFSMFLPYELKDKYCAAIADKKYILFDDRFESYLTVSNQNVKVCRIAFNSDNKYYGGGNITQFGYKEEYNYNNGVASVNLVKAKYVYAQSAVSVKGEYETYVNGTDMGGVPCPQTIKVNLLLQKGWNIIYHIGNFTPVPDTYFGRLDTAIINITTERPENIELKWYYRFCSDFNFYDILENENVQFIYMPFMMSYLSEFILNF